MLRSRDAQRVDAVGFECGLPSRELLGRKLVALACLIETDHAASHAVNHRGFAMGGTGEPYRPAANSDRATPFYSSFASRENGESCLSPSSSLPEPND
jgi:hypothetical protein